MTNIMLSALVFCLGYVTALYKLLSLLLLLLLIVMGLLRVVGNHVIKKMSLKIEKHEKIAMLDVSTLNTISSLISKALTDDSISDKEYSLILLEFQTFTRMKEDLRIKSKTSLEKTGNIETDDSVLFNRNSTNSPT